MARYGWSATTPSGSVITTAEAKKHLDIPASEKFHNASIDNMISAAVSLFEHSTRILLLSRTITLVMDSLPLDDTPIDLPVYPVTTFTSITNIISGTPTLWASSNYVTDLVSRPNRVAPTTDGEWACPDNRIGAVTMVFDAGYALANIPLDIKHSLLMLVAHWFEVPQTVVVGTIVAQVPWAVQLIWDKYNMGETYSVGSHL